MPDDTSNPKDTSKDQQAFVTLLIIIVVGVAGIIFYTLCSESCSQWCSNLSIGMLVACASLSSGGFFGFLFGMPRSTARRPTDKHKTDAPEDKNETNNPNNGNTEPNTNLEEISDWLTKILVGAGLTQLNKIPHKLDQLSGYIAKGMGDPVSGQAFVIAVIIFFGVCGFLAVFLWTRLYMAKLLEPEQLTLLRLEALRRDELLRQESLRRDKLLEAKSALRGVLNIQHPTNSQIFLSTADEAMKKAFAVRQDFLADRSLGILMGRVVQAQKGYEAAISFLTQVISDFRREGKDQTVDFAALLYNRACYKNRRADQIKENQPTEAATIEKYRADAWEDLKNSCKIDPKNKEEAQNDPDIKDTLPNGADREWSKL